jgi:hypothetical protein
MVSAGVPIGQGYYGDAALNSNPGDSELCTHDHEPPTDRQNIDEGFAERVNCSVILIPIAAAERREVGGLVK